MEYLLPQGVLLPLVYGTTASPLWLELRGHSAWQATPSWAVYQLACHRLLPWLRVTFAMVPDAAWPGSDQWPWSTAPPPGPVGRPGRPSASNSWGVGSFLSLGRPTCVPCPGPPGSCSPVCPRGLLCCVCGVLGHLALVHGAPARCVVLRVRSPGPLGSRSPVCPLDVLCCVCGVLGHLAPVHRCARSVCCFACVVFTGVPALSFVLFVRCRGPLGSCSPVCPLGVLLCVCGVLGLLAPVHRCTRPWCPVPLLPSVHVRVRCPGPRGACSPVCALCAVRVCRWWLCPSSSPPNFRFFCLLCFFFEMEKRGRAYTAGTSTGNWCSGAILFCSLACVSGAWVAVAPQGCGSRVLML